MTNDTENHAGHGGGPGPLVRGGRGGGQLLRLLRAARVSVLAVSGFGIWVSVGRV